MTNLKKPAADMVKEAKARIENLSVEQVVAELEGGDTLLVDLRDSEERSRDGTIPNAVHVPRGMLEFRADPTSPYHREGLDPDRRIILYCASGGRSALGAETLEKMGYKHVAHLDGGFKSWKDKGQAVEKVRQSS
jgi:rhodanese-related sulfurtransferase